MMIFGENTFFMFQLKNADLDEKFVCALCPGLDWHYNVYKKVSHNHCHKKKFHPTLRSSCSFNIFSASPSDTGISSEATSFWVLFNLKNE